jgi:hypothetical protein
VWAATFISGQVLHRDLCRQVGVIPTPVSGLARLLAASPTAAAFFQTWQNLCRLAFLCLAAEQLLEDLQTYGVNLPAGTLTPVFPAGKYSSRSA